jgi:hypothetical protein
MAAKKSPNKPSKSSGTKPVDKWIPSDIKKGGLHSMLGIDQSKPIPTSTLNKIKNAEPGSKVNGKTVTPLMKKRANFAANVRK